MDKYFFLSGFEGDIPFSCKFTMVELIMNIGELKDSEIFFTLKELYEDDILDMTIGCTKHVFLNRDNIQFKGVLQRVHIFVFNNFTNQTCQK